MNQKLRTIFSISIFAAVLGLAMLAIVSKRQQLFGWQLMAVRSGSMEPTIPVGSVVLVKNESHYAPGDVVTYRSSQNAGVLVTHRIVELDQTGEVSAYRLKGDNNPVIDQQSVNLTQIQGKVQYFIPLLGYLFTFLQTPAGVVFFILVPGIILVYEEIKSLYGQMKQVFVRPQLMVLWVMFGVITIGVVPTWAVYATSTQVQNLNFQTGHWIEPTLTVERNEDDLIVKINQPGDHDQAHYSITYTHLVEGEPVAEVIEGDAEVQVTDDVFTLPAFFIGTCSTDDVCTPHEQVTELQVKVELKKDGTVDQTLTAPLEWE